tara:strand:- start:1421 stop:3238 length:1818 start_codon:yes stop_codon:yes gene_type:complete
MRVIRFSVAFQHQQHLSLSSSSVKKNHRHRITNNNKNNNNERRRRRRTTKGFWSLFSFNDNGDRTNEDRIDFEEEKRTRVNNVIGNRCWHSSRRRIESNRELGKEEEEEQQQQSHLALRTTLAIATTSFLSWQLLLFFLQSALLPARANATTNTSKNNNNSSTTFRILKGTTNKKSRAKRNSFVRQAAESVGPCVVRVDALMPSPSSSQKEQQQQQKEQQQQREDEGPSPKKKNEDEDEAPKRKKNNRNENGNDTRYDEWHAGGGCGLVLDATLGRVVTNAHVVGDAQKVRVTFTDGRTYIADVKGVDQTADIALLKLNLRASHVLPSCDIGNSDEVDVGDWAVAVGNPFGLDNSVALGIISNLARTSTELGIPERRSVEFFQTDCAINPGNSGGPLVNEFSEVIAINAAIRQDADGIGFAIPINTVRRVAEALSRGEIIARPYLGIEMATLLEGGTSSSPASSMQASSGDNNANATDNTTKNPPREGALIVKVSDASPAHLAGVRIGDVIIDCNGEAIVDANQVRRIVLEADPGKVLSIVVWRVDTFTLETLDVVVGDASLGRVSTAKSANSNCNNNVHSNNNNNKGKDLVIAPPGMGGIQRRA